MIACGYHPASRAHNRAALHIGGAKGLRVDFAAPLA